jgi:hypothetical protein
VRINIRFFTVYQAMVTLIGKLAPQGKEDGRLPKHSEFNGYLHPAK